MILTQVYGIHALVLTIAAMVAPPIHLPIQIFISFRGNNLLDKIQDGYQIILLLKERIQ